MIFGHQNAYSVTLVEDSRIVHSLCLLPELEISDILLPEKVDERSVTDEI